jgi:hypothetical protein
MFDRELLLKAYGDYRESIGRPRVNKLEEIENSIPFNHFEAGQKWAIKTLTEMGLVCEKLVYQAEDAL